MTLSTIKTKLLILLLVAFAASTAKAQPRPKFDEKKAKWGYVDDSGKWVIKPKYDIEAPFAESPLPSGEYRAIVFNKDKWSLINTEGKNLSGNHESITPDGGKLLIIGDKDRFGVIDYNGNTIIKNELDRVIPSANGGGVFLKKTSWGYFNRDGAITLEPEHDAVTDWGFDMLLVRDNGTYGIANYSGMMTVPSTFKSLEMVSPTRIVATGTAGTSVITPDGKTIIAPGNYTKIAMRPDGNFSVTTSAGEGLVGADGQRIIAPGRYTGFTMGPGELITVHNGSLIGYADKSGKMLIPIEFNKIDRTADNLFVATKGNTISVYTTDGKVVVSDCDSIADRVTLTDPATKSPVAMLPYKKEGKPGCVKTNGTGGITHGDYDRIIEYLPEKGLVVMGSEDMRYFIDPSGNKLCDYATKIEDTDIYRYQKDDKLGLVDAKGNFMTEPLYDNITKYDNTNFIYGFSGSKSTTWNLKGKELWSKNCEAQFYLFGDDDNFTVALDDSNPASFGVISRDGELVVDMNNKSFTELKSALKTAGITDPKVLASLKNSIDQYEAERIAAISPRATINSVTVDHNYYQNGVKGMKIHVSFDVVNAYRHDLSVVAWFSHNNSKGNKLMDRDGRYRTKDGQVSTSENACPGYENSTYSDFTLFLPYSQLDLKRSAQRYNLKFYVGVYDKTTRKHIGSSDWEYFTFGY